MATATSPTQTKQNHQPAHLNFLNLLWLESNRFWLTKQKWLQPLVWSLVFNGLVGYFLLSSSIILESLSVPAPLQPYIAQMVSSADTQVLLYWCLSFYYQFASLLLPIGIIVMMNGTIISERDSGAMAWLLSNPVPRENVILSKFVANFVHIVLYAVLVPGVVLYGLLAVVLGVLLPVGPYIISLLFMVLVVFFYVAFMLFLGTVFKSRGPLLVVALVVSQIGGFVEFIDVLYDFIVNTTPLTFGTQGFIFLLKSEVTKVEPLLVSTVLGVLFLAGSVLMFRRDQF